jgi:hypothetical protein
MNMPSRRREKDWMRWYCCSVGRYSVVRRCEVRGGRAVLRAEKATNRGNRSCT